MLSVCLTQLDQFVCRHLLSKCWYCTQVLPITPESVRHINTLIACFICKGNICRYPLHILHLSRQKCGLGLLDIKAKFYTLFINRCTQLLERRVSLHDRVAYTMFCNVRDRQPARHKCFAKRIAELLTVCPKEMLLDTGDHRCVRTRISKPFVYPFPISPGEIFSYQDHGDEPHNCKECCVEQLVPQFLGSITYCIGTNNT